MQHTYQSLMAQLTREQRLDLLQRSDWIGLLHLLGHWGAIVANTTLIIWQVPGWQALLVVQGVLIISNFALLHETIHKTAFATAWLNTVASNVCGLLIMTGPIWFRHFHTDHHRYTNDPQKDPELATPRPETLLQYLVYMSALPVLWSNFRLLVVNALFVNRDPYVGASRRAAVRREAWLFLCIYAAAIGGSVYTASTLLLWIWLVPVVIGQPFLRAYLLAEHGGCPLVEDMLLNTRTTYTSAVVRFLAWNMPYHTEHHVFPAIPFHNLPKFHDIIRDHLNVTENGYVRFHKQFIRDLYSNRPATEKASTMHAILDLDKYPLHDLTSPAGQSLVEQCKADLVQNGMFNLPGFLRADAVDAAISHARPQLDTNAFVHKRAHNIYFEPSVPGLDDDHPVMRTFETMNHTICGDQIPGNVLIDVYEWEPFRKFLTTVMEKPVLYTTPDPLARVNVMAYRDGEALNWHFDRSEFTTTLLLQASNGGGNFEYRTDLRSNDDPNYDGVVRLFEGKDDQIRQIKLDAGTLNVFRGKNTLHRVTPVEGDHERIITVFSYFENPDVNFSVEERIGFYGRAS
jgi:fatty acid desaturase